MASDYEEHQIDWKGQDITVRWCPQWLGGDTAHLEIVTKDRQAHPHIRNRIPLALLPARADGRGRWPGGVHACMA